MAEISMDGFLAEAKAFLDANAELKGEEKKFVWGEGPDGTDTFGDHNRDQERAELAKAKAWRQKKFDAGFAWCAGPSQYGGRDLPSAYQRAYDQLESKYLVPNQSFFGIGLGMVAPTFLAHGTDVVKDRYLRALWRGEIVGSQLFSEPGAGSDLASLQCKAERDGDEWILNGQKVWTSGAQYSEVGEIVCRTDPEMPKHKGITAFAIDMKAPGVEIRPLRQMTGGAHFNEVFLTDVRVPDDHRLGDVNDGWRVALTTLMNERSSIGTGSGGGSSGMMSPARLVEMVRHFGLADDPVVRDELMSLLIGMRVAGYTNQRALARMRAGQTPGPEMSLAKMQLTNNMRKTCNFVSSVLGPRLIADTGEWGTYSWAGFLLSEPSMHIAGGSDEVMRNIVGERVLGMPKDPGIDDKSPFKTLKVGTQTSKD